MGSPPRSSHFFAERTEAGGSVLVWTRRPRPSVPRPPPVYQGPCCPSARASDASAPSHVITDLREAAAAAGRSRRQASAGLSGSGHCHHFRFRTVSPTGPGCLARPARPPPARFAPSHAHRLWQPRCSHGALGHVSAAGSGAPTAHRASAETRSLGGSRPSGTVCPLGSVACVERRDGSPAPQGPPTPVPVTTHPGSCAFQSRDRELAVG